MSRCKLIDIHIIDIATYVIPEGCVDGVPVTIALADSQRNLTFEATVHGQWNKQIECTVYKVQAPLGRPISAFFIGIIWIVAEKPGYLIVCPQRGERLN
jgi:hypothetical protein